jgi:hypothetical protein
VGGGGWGGGVTEGMQELRGTHAKVYGEGGGSTCSQVKWRRDGQGMMKGWGGYGEGMGRTCSMCVLTLRAQGVW